MRTLKEAQDDMKKLSEFLNANEKKLRCRGPCPGFASYFDDLVSELRDLGEPSLQ
jgi:hypothetical protein